jgi:transposase
MHDSTTWIGMDVHKESILVAAVNGAGATAARWEAPNTLKGKERLAKRLSEFGTIRCAYEAGPCGYDLRRFLEEKGIPCDVIAPSLIPKKPGDRVKTDKKDAEKIARMHRMGELTAIHVPTPAQEAIRDLLRAREDATEDLVRRRHRLQKFLLRQGRRFEGKNWTRDHWRWIRAQKVEDPNSETVLSEYVAAIDQEIERIGRLDAQIEEESKNPQIAPAIARLKSLRGVKTLTAMTILSELIDLNRFESARKLMGFVGLVPGEYSSGGKQWRGSITKSGNSHVRRVLVEAAWHYRHSPRKTGEAIRKRREGQPPEVIETARKAELRLYKKFTRLVMRGKKTTVAATAVARELAGFVWAIGRI